MIQRGRAGSSPRAVGHVAGPRGHSRLMTLAGLCVWLVTSAAWAEGLPQPKLPEPIRTNRAVFTIPFRLEEPASREAAPQRVILAVSRDLGGTWRDVDEVLPSAGQFTYRATTDGEYWFRLRSEDAEGRIRGGRGPDVRVILNAAGPRLAARVWLGPDGEVVCRFAAFDDTLNLASLQLEYHTATEPAWQPIDAVAMLSRESPAHLVGEELWWAGDNPQGLTARLTIRDESGNTTTQQYALEPSDPGVSQHQLAREIGAPPLPGSEPPPEPDPPLPSRPSQVAGSGPADPSGSLASGEGSPWMPGGVDAGWSSQAPRGGRVPSVLTASRPQPSAFGGPPTPGSADEPADARPSFGQLQAGRPPGSEALAQTTAVTAGGVRLYKGKALQVSRSRRFAWDYAIDSATAGGGLGGVELWGTRDGGVTWQLIARDDDCISPIDVALEQPGLHGFRLELAASGEQVQPPRSGDMPQCWGVIDEVPPTVSIRSVVTSADPSATGGETIAISYASDDPLLEPRGGRLQFSPNATGPWATVADGLEATGRYLWNPDRSVPARVYLRIEVADTAGNVGAAVTTEPVPVGGGRPIGQLGGLRPLPTTPTP